jgi:hypothetical protein
MSEGGQFEQSNLRLRIAVIATLLLLCTVCVVPTNLTVITQGEHKVMAAHGPTNQALPGDSFDLFFDVSAILLICLVVYGKLVQRPDQVIPLRFAGDAHYIRPPPAR